MIEKDSQSCSQPSQARSLWVERTYHNIVGFKMAIYAGVPVL